MREVQQRTEITSANTWTPISIPVGAYDFILQLEDGSATFRVSVDNSINATNNGLFVDATGMYSQEGVNTAIITLYVSASTTTFVVVQYTN
jgi:hypothetical protein